MNPNPYFPSLVQVCSNDKSGWLVEVSLQKQTLYWIPLGEKGTSKRIVNCYTTKCFILLSEDFFVHRQNKNASHTYLSTSKTVLARVLETFIPSHFISFFKNLSTEQTQSIKAWEGRRGETQSRNARICHMLEVHQANKKVDLRVHPQFCKTILWICYNM